jgi:hypothetical protein
MNDVAAFMKEFGRSLWSFHTSALLSCRSTARGTILEAKTKLSADTKQIGTLILEFPTFRTGRNEFLFIN